MASSQVQQSCRSSEQLESRTLLSASELIISQLLFSSSRFNERVEIYNTSETGIDLTGYVLADANGSALSEANITGGTIGAGESAVLYPAGTPFGYFLDTDYNIIPVEDWDSIELPTHDPWTISLWQTYDTYISDSTTHSNAVDTVPFDRAKGFPYRGSDLNSESTVHIELNSADVDNSIGANWSVAYRENGLGDPLGPGIAAPVSVELDDSNSPTSFGIRLTAKPESDVVLNVTSADPSNVLAVETVVITPEDWQRTTFRLTGPTDSIVDGDQIVSLRFSVNDALSSDEFDSVPDIITDVLVRDLDYASISISSPVVGEFATTADFVVELSMPTDVAVTVLFSTVEGSARASVDFTALVDHPVVFAPGETTVVVSVPVIPGDQLAAPKTFIGRVTRLISDDRNILIAEPVEVAVVGYRSGITTEFTPDGNAIVYLADSVLYASAVTGGEAVRLTEPSHYPRDVKSYAIAPDGQTVVYLSDHENVGRFELYSVSIGGGRSTKLNHALAAGHEIKGGFYSTAPPLISADSQYVVYRVDGPTEGYYDTGELYSVPIGGGDPLRLSTNASVLFAATISPDSRSVLFVAEADDSCPLCLYQVPITGGAGQWLVRPDDSPIVTKASYSPDGAAVIYINRSSRGGVFSVPATGGVATRINAELPINWSVESYEVSLDSSNIAYTIRDLSGGDGQVRISSLTRISDGAISQQTPNAEASLFPIGQDGFLIVSDSYPTEMWKFSRSIGEIERLPIESAGVSGFYVGVSDAEVFYTLMPEASPEELRAFRLDGGGSRIVNAVVSGHGSIRTSAVSPDGDLVAYIFEGADGLDVLLVNQNSQSGTATIGEDPGFLVTSPIGSTTDKRPQLSWAGTPHTESYDVWVNLDGTGVNVFQQRGLSAGSTSLDLPIDLEFGRYRVFVTARLSDGSVRDSQSHTFVVNQQIGTEVIGSTLDTNPTLSWQRVPGAVGYRLFVNNPGTPVVEDVIDSDPHSTGLISHQLSTALSTNDYRWWVRPIRDNGWLGAWSDAAEFSTGGRTKVRSNQNGDRLTSTPHFYWQAVPDAQAYEVYVSKDGSPNPLFRRAGLSSPGYPSPALSDGEYRVWVRTTLSDGSSVWGAVVRFSVAELSTQASQEPSEPIQPTQPVGAGIETTPTFTWPAIPSAWRYEIYLHNGTEAIDSRFISEASWTPSTPLAAGSWNWTVRPYTPHGYGVWSDPVHFNTYGRTELLTAVTSGSGLPILTWGPVAGAALYSLQVDSLTTSESKVIRVDGLTETSFTPAVPLTAGSYRAGVRAINGTVLGAWSIPSDFDVTA